METAVNVVEALRRWVLHFKEHPFFEGVMARIPRSVTPNHISAGRVVFLIPALPLMDQYANVPSLLLVILCFVGDFVDGALAKYRFKKYGEKSPHGAFIDQAFDKFVSVGLQLYLWPRLWDSFNLPIGISISIAVSLLLLRTNAYVRAWIRDGEPPEESQTSGASGKWKTIFEMFSIGGMILGLGIESDAWLTFALVLLHLSNVFAIFSLLRRWRKT